MGRANVSYQPFRYSSPMETNCYDFRPIKITFEPVPLIGDGVAVVAVSNGGGPRERFPSPACDLAGAV